MSTEFIYLTDLQVACGVTDARVRELAKVSRVSNADDSELVIPEINGYGPADYSATASHILGGRASYVGRNMLGQLVYSLNY